MTTLEQAARQAIGTLEIAEGACAHHGFVKMIQNSISDLRQALEQPKQEQEQYTYTSTQATTCAVCGKHKHTPLRVDSMGGYVCLTCIDRKLGEFGYPSPPQREWVGLTDADIKQGFQESWVTEQAWQSAVWWAEQRLKELNT